MAQSFFDPRARDARKVLEPEQARQGVMLGHMRYVLGVSLTLAVVAGAILLLGYF